MNVGVRILAVFVFAVFVVAVFVMSDSLSWSFVVLPLYL